MNLVKINNTLSDDEVADFILTLTTGNPVHVTAADLTRERVAVPVTGACTAGRSGSREPDGSAPHSALR